MLRQFQYMDQNGKDQGINVRNRAKELAELLSDVDRIRSERKKARTNRNKFGGVEGGAGIGGGFSGGGSRYGGFGSEDAGFGGFSGGVYGDGGGFGGRDAAGGGFSDGGGRRDRFEEYDEADDQPSSSRHHTSTRRKPDPPKPKVPEVDLFDFGDDVPPAAPPKPGAASSGKQPVDLTGGDDEDDFGDFASAPSGGAAPAQAISPPTTQFAQPKPVSGAGASNIQGIMATMSPTPPAGGSGVISPPPSSAGGGVGQSMTPLSSISGSTGTGFAAPTQQGPPKPAVYQAPTPNYFTSIQTTPTPQGQQAAARPGMQTQASFGSTTGGGGSGGGIAASNAAKSPPTTGKPSGGSDAFGSLWSSASAGAGIKKNTQSHGPNLASLAKEKAEKGIWGADAPKSAGAGNAQSQQMGGQQGAGGGLDDLLG
jgi:epsin